MRRFFCIITGLIAVVPIFAQYNLSDSLRGGYGTTRNWWDITHYDLHVDFDAQTKTISGYNAITFKVLPPEEILLQSEVNQHPQKLQSTGNTGMIRPNTDFLQQGQHLQIDLQAPLKIDSILLDGKRMSIDKIRQIGNAYFIETTGLNFPEASIKKLAVYYHGKPREAVKAPWDGGVIWKKDEQGLPWITVACQGLGASVWFPCKDSQMDEPDSVDMHYTCDSRLVCVSNGHFTNAVEHENGKTTYSWHVANPINNYCMIPYIGNYVNMHDHFRGEKGMLEMDYWVLKGHEEQAEKQFADAPRTIEALEYWFGPYPFYEDGYKLVEAPHLGMEHQSAIAYGNGFQNGYLGKDLSGTGEGLKWDFIIVHESGHEWFGNNITSKDIADMWIHESFTNYSETLFMDYWFGTEHGNTYCEGLRKNIVNDKPIIGDYGVQNEGSGDMYYKGANMLHTIRQVVGNDTLFRTMLRGLNDNFYHRTVTTSEVEQYMSHVLKLPLKTIFDQYLRTTQIPVLEIKYGKSKVKYRWKESVPGLQLPVRFYTSEKTSVVLTPSKKWKKHPISTYTHFFGPDSNYYVKVVKTD